MSRYRQAAVRQRRERKIAAGICTDCPDSAERGFLMCAKHRVRAQKAQQEDRKRLKPLGLTAQSMSAYRQARRQYLAREPEDFRAWLEEKCAFRMIDRRRKTKGA